MIYFPYLLLCIKYVLVFSDILDVNFHSFLCKTLCVVSKAICSDAQLVSLSCLMLDIVLWFWPFQAQWCLETFRDTLTVLLDHSILGEKLAMLHVEGICSWPWPYNVLSFHRKISCNNFIIYLMITSSLCLEYV